jgi:hypothetical protein
MDLYALGIGVLVAIVVVLGFRAGRLEATRWVYPALLATFPVYYWVFAVYASDYRALPGEIVASVAFLAIAFIAYEFRSFATLLLQSVGYVAHAAYDFHHDALLSNSGVPTWWPEFCGSVDVLLGCYLAWLALALRKRGVLA